MLFSLIPFFAGAENTLFDNIKKLSAQERLDTARLIYKQHLRHSDSATAFFHLTELEHLSEKWNDKILQCNVLTFRADYLSVNKGLNPLSLEYHQQAIDFAKKNDLRTEEAIQIFKRGEYYFTYREIVPAYRNYLEAYELFQKIGFENVPKIDLYLQKTGTLYYSVRDFDNARKMLLEALKYQTLTPAKQVIDELNTVGLCYREEKNHDKALEYFRKAEKVAQRENNSVWEHIIAGNIGSIYYKQGKYNEALPLLWQDYYGSSQLEPFNAYATLLSIVDIMLQKGNTDTAVTLLNSVPCNLSSADLLELRIKRYRLLMNIAEKQNKRTEQIDYLKKYELAKDSLAERNNLAAIERINLNREKDKYYLEISQQKTIRNALLMSIVLFAVIMLLLFNRYRLKHKLEKERLAKEKQLAEAEAVHARQQLENFTQHLLDKSRLLGDIKTQFNEEEKLLASDKLRHFTILTEEDWYNFKELFEQVHPHFFTQLTQNIPDITPAEIRFLALCKLNLSSKEMAAILGIAPNSIRIQRYRLRKKMDGIRPNVTLQHLIENL